MKNTHDNITNYTDNASVTRSGCQLRGLRKHQRQSQGCGSDKYSQYNIGDSVVSGLASSVG